MSTSIPPPSGPPPPRSTPPPPRFGRTPHLVTLIAEVTALTDLLRAVAEPDPDVVADTRNRALLATLQLDGSPVDVLPSEEQLAALGLPSVDDQPVPPARSSSWYMSFDAMTEVPDEHLQALEARGVAAAFGADELAGELRDDPIGTLAALHTRLTVGLVAPERAGRPREVEQAVHDASIGRILYHTADPADIAAALQVLADWLRGPGVVAHGLITAGILHLEVLRIHPFDAANGRLARAAARLALRAADLDPHGLAAPEIALARDPLGYHEEVASTVRRRDASIWLERWGDAVVAGLRGSCRGLGLLTTEPPAEAAAFLDGLTVPGFTVADYRAHRDGDVEAAHADLLALLDAGAIDRVPGSRGLRFVVAAS